MFHMLLRCLATLILGIETITVLAIIMGAHVYQWEIIAWLAIAATGLGSVLYLAARKAL